MDAESLEMLARSSCTAHPQSFGGAPAESSCKHEHSHIVDSKTHGGGYAGPVSRRIFCSHCRLQRWLDVEAALALAQADVGVIPPRRRWRSRRPPGFRPSTCSRSPRVWPAPGIR